MKPDWFIAQRALRCGRCGERIPSAAPVRRLQYGGLRCAPCAHAMFGDEVPVDLVPETRPADIHERIDALMRRTIERRTQGALDFKARQAKDD